MDNMLYKFKIIKGKEKVAEEWLNFLVTNKEAGEKLLKREQAYFEAYFKNIEDDNMYVYMFFSCKDINFSNNKALNEGSKLDKKHFEYMKECIDFEKGNIMECVLYLNNLKDAIV